MYQKTIASLLSISILISSVGCQKYNAEEVIPQEEKVEILSPKIIDMRGKANEIEGFVNSVLRTASSKSSFSVNDYDLSNTEFLENNSGMEVYSSKSKSTEREYLIVLRKGEHVQSVNLVRILKDENESVTMEYVSALNKAVLFRGYLDKKTGVFHVTYMDGSLKEDQLRASIEGLLCNLSMYGAGASWTYALSLISGGASFALGLAWTVASYYVCDGVK